MAFSRGRTSWRTPVERRTGQDVQEGARLSETVRSGNVDYAGTAEGPFVILAGQGELGQGIHKLRYHRTAHTTFPVQRELVKASTRLLRRGTRSRRRM